MVHVTGGTERSAIGGPGGGEDARHLDVPGVRRVRAVCAVAVREAVAGGRALEGRRRAPPAAPAPARGGARTAASRGGARGGRVRAASAVRLVAAAAAAAAGPAGTGARRLSLHRVRLGLGLVAVALHASSVVVFGFGVVPSLRHLRLRGDVVAGASLGRGRPQG